MPSIVCDIVSILVQGRADRTKDALPYSQGELCHRHLPGGRVASQGDSPGHGQELLLLGVEGREEQEG